jgi:hypothetical protein
VAKGVRGKAVFGFAVPLRAAEQSQTSPNDAKRETRGGKPIYRLSLFFVSSHSLGGTKECHQPPGCPGNLSQSGVLSMACTIGQAITGISTPALGSFLAFAAIVAGAALTMKVECSRIMQEG